MTNAELRAAEALPGILASMRRMEVMAGRMTRALEALATIYTNYTINTAEGGTRRALDAAARILFDKTMLDDIKADAEMQNAGEDAGEQDEEGGAE